MRISFCFGRFSDLYWRGGRKRERNQETSQRNTIRLQEKCQTIVHHRDMFRNHKHKKQDWFDLCDGYEDRRETPPHNKQTTKINPPSIPQTTKGTEREPTNNHPPHLAFFHKKRKRTINTNHPRFHPSSNKNARQISQTNKLKTNLSKSGSTPAHNLTLANQLGIKLTSVKREIDIEVHSVECSLRCIHSLEIFLQVLPRQVRCKSDDFLDSCKILLVIAQTSNAIWRTY